MVYIHFCKNFTRLPFCGGWTKNLQTFSRNFFWQRPSKYCIVELTAVFMCLLLSWSRRYSMKWSSNLDGSYFNNSWPLYLNFSNMINLCPNIWFIKNSKYQQFVFWKRSRQKTQIFLISKGRYFAMGCPIDMNFGVFWETPVDFLKSVVLQLFPKYIQNNVNLNVKSRAKIQLPLKSRGVVLVFSIWM